MKKSLILAAIAAVTALGFISCSDDDPNPPYVPVTVSNGIYILNEGNAYSNINGSLSYYDYTKGTVANEIYKSVNGTVLGGTPNDAIVYGSKLYITSTDEKTVFVADAATVVEKKKITTTDASGVPVMPREFLAANGKVYVSTYGSCVLAIDTTTLAIIDRYDCGTNAEGMAISADGNTLYVANSDGYTYNGSISAINLASGQTTTISGTGITNPVSIFIVGSDIYTLDAGSYDASWNSVGAGIYKLNSSNTAATKVVAATMAKYDAGKFYFINAPYTTPATTPTYCIYDIASGTQTPFVSGDDILAPAAIAVDPIKGNVVITSYNMAYGYADYSSDGYAVIYDAAGQKLNKVDVGVGPTTIVFNTVTK